MKYLKSGKNENENSCSKRLRCSKGSSKREVYSNTVLPQEGRNISKTQPIITPKGNKIKTKQI